MGNQNGEGIVCRPWASRMGRLEKEVGHYSRSVYIVDDHALLCQGMAAILREDGYIIMGMQTHVKAALADVLMCGADVVVLDITGESEARIKAIPAMVMRGKKVVVCSLYADQTLVRRAIKSGASAYVSKTDDVNCLLDAVRAAAGEACAGVDRSIEERHVGKHCAPEWSRLSERESEVALLVGEGMATAEIARQMGVSPRTVDAFYSRIINKLRFSGRRDLRRSAVAFARLNALRV